MFKLLLVKESIQRFLERSDQNGMAGALRSAVFASSGNYCAFTYAFAGKAVVQFSDVKFLFRFLSCHY
jgi:hypothetical protein